MITDTNKPHIKACNTSIEGLLDRLDGHLKGAPVGEEGRHLRYRRSDLVLAISHPGGGNKRVAAHSYSLWCEGIGVLHSGFAYPGSSCAIALPTTSRSVHQLMGRVSSCRHVEDTWHSTDIKFTHRVDPHMFIDRAQKSASNNENDVEISNLCGRLLYLDDSEIDHLLMAHYLGGSGVELISMKAEDEAIECLRSSMIDIFLCDLNLGGTHSGVEVVRRAREIGFTGPIAVVSAETSPAKLALAKSAGAEHQLGKPYQRPVLIELLTKLHREAGAIVSGGVIYSALDDQADMEALLKAFVTEAKLLAERIQQGIRSQDFEGARQLCLNIKGSAAGYGFARLGLAAEEAIRGLDSTMSLEETRAPLRMLTLTCSRIGVRKAAKQSTGGGEKLC